MPNIYFFKVQCWKSVYIFLKKYFLSYGVMLCDTFWLAVHPSIHSLKLSHRQGLTDKARAGVHMVRHAYSCSPLLVARLGLKGAVIDWCCIFIMNIWCSVFLFFFFSFLNNVSKKWEGMLHNVWVSVPAACSCDLLRAVRTERILHAALCTHLLGSTAAHCNSMCSAAGKVRRVVI